MSVSSSSFHARSDRSRSKERKEFHARSDRSRSPYTKRHHYPSRSRSRPKKPQANAFAGFLGGNNEQKPPLPTPPPAHLMAPPTVKIFDLRTCQASLDLKTEKVVEELIIPPPPKKKETPKEFQPVVDTISSAYKELMKTNKGLPLLLLPGLDCRVVQPSSNDLVFKGTFQAPNGAELSLLFNTEKLSKRAFKLDVGCVYEQQFQLIWSDEESPCAINRFASYVVGRPIYGDAIVYFNNSCITY